MREIRRVTKNYGGRLWPRTRPERLLKEHTRKIFRRVPETISNLTRRLRVWGSILINTPAHCVRSPWQICVLCDHFAVWRSRHHAFLSTRSDRSRWDTTLHRQVMFPIVGRDLSQREEMREKGCKKALALHAIHGFFKKSLVYNLLTRKKRWCINSIKSSWK